MEGVGPIRPLRKGEMEVMKMKEEERTEGEREKEVEEEKEMEEVEVEEVDPWSHEQVLPVWWLVLAATLGPFLLVLRLLAMSAILASRCLVRPPLTNLHLLPSVVVARLGLVGGVDTSRPLTGWRRLAQVHSILHHTIAYSTSSIYSSSPSSSPTSSSPSPSCTCTSACSPSPSACG